MTRSEVKRLSDELKQEAMNLGMCKDGVNDWTNFTSLDALCEHYWDGIEFILDHPGYPSDKWLVDNVGKKMLNAHGIYINQSVNVGNPKNLILNGKCKGRAIAGGFSTPVIYVRGFSDLELVVTDAAIVNVNVYDNAKLVIHCEKYTNVHVYQYGGTVHYDGEGKVIVRDKRK